MMLLPIAYSTFFMMMNSKKLMGVEKPEGGRLTVWNILMGISVIGAFIAAGTAVYDKGSHPVVGKTVTIVGVVFAIALVVGFFKKKSPQSS